MEKTRRENRRYSTEFKICVIMDMREHNLRSLNKVLVYGGACSAVTNLRRRAFKNVAWKIKVCFYLYDRAVPGDSFHENSFTISIKYGNILYI